MPCGPAAEHARPTPPRRVAVLATQIAAVLGVAHGSAGASARDTALLPPAPSSVTVGNCADAGAGSLREALTNAAPGQVIDLTQLNCSVISLATGALTATQPGLELLGPGSDLLAIDGGGTQPVLSATGSGVLTVSGLTLRNGYRSDAAPSGGCLAVTGDLVLESSVVAACNAATSACASARGGAVSVAGDAFIHNSTVRDSHATTPDCTNGARAYGGGLYVYGRLRLQGSTVSGNASSFSHGNGNGGGVSVRGSSTFVDSVIENNYAPAGGGVFAETTTTLTGSTVSGNRALGQGGGLFINGPTLSTVTRSLIAHNSVSGGSGFVVGGGIWTSGQISLIDAQLSHNSAPSGAALYAQGYITVQRSTIDYNTGGSAIYNNGIAGARIVNSTIVGNTHWPSPYGSASISLRGSATVANSTVAFNAGGPAGALLVGGARLNLHSNLFAGNHTDTQPLDVFAQPPTVVLGEDNLIMAPYAAIPPLPQTISTCPKLDRLAQNGGPTPTVMLLPGSAGIDAGNDIYSLGTDQRGAGFVRAFGAGPDVGSFEQQGETSDALFSSAFEAYCDSHHRS